MRGIKIVFIGLALLLTSYSIKSQDKGVLLDEILAVVGDEIVLKSDLDFRITEMKAQGLEVTDEIESVIFEELLFQKLLINQAKIDSLEVTDAEVNTQLDERIDYYVSQFPTEADFEKFYGKTTNQLKEDFRQDVNDQILTSKMQRVITSSLRITPKDVQKFYDGIPKDSLPLVEAEVQYAQIVMKPKVSKAQIDDVKSQLNKYREDLITSPYKFGLYATLYSQDPGSANSQNLGCYRKVEKGVMVSEFEQEVLNLEPGQITEPFKTDFGYHIARLENKSGKYYDVCHILLNVEPLEVNILESQKKLDTLRESIMTVDTLTFSLAATMYSQDKETRAAGGVVPNQYTGGTKHELSQIDPQITLILNQLKAGEVSTPVLFNDRSGTIEYRLFYLQERFKAHAATLETDYSLIKRMAESEAQNKALEEWISKKLMGTYCRINPQYEEYAFRYNWASN